MADQKQRYVLHYAGEKYNLDYDPELSAYNEFGWLKIDRGEGKSLEIAVDPGIPVALEVLPPRQPGRAVAF